MQLADQHGYANAYAGFLPRPTATFTQGAFGPFSPILPVPVDEPDPASGRADPRREEYRVGWNLPVGTPGSEGLKLASFSTLRTLADLYSVARACIQLRKSEIRGLEWDILPTQEAAKANRGDKAWFKDFGERRAKAKKFFKRPDPDYYSWSTFIDAFLEEVFVFDALSLFLRPKRGRGMRKGLLGSDLDSLNLISGPTIRPLYDMHGGYPAPPAPAYQQYLYGVPRSDFIKMLTDMDIQDGGLRGSEVGQFRGDQLLYVPMVPRRWTPYGFPPIERAMIPVLSGLQKQGYQLDYFREGTVPAVYMSPGDENMTPNQIRELQDALNAFAGDPAWHHKIIVLPPGTKVEPQRGVQLADAFDEIVMTQVCMAFDIMPMELGIAPKVSTSMSPGASHQMAKMAENVGERKATKPTLMFIADIINNILEYVCGQDDMQFVFEGLEAEEDEALITDLLIKQVENGLRSVDEARDKLNLQPWGLPETSGPVFLSKNGPVPFGAVTAGTTDEPGVGDPGQLSLSGLKPELPVTATGTAQTQSTGQADVPTQAAAPQHPETPGHASATGDQKTPPRSAAKPQAAAPAKKADAASLAKAVSSELEALSRHVKKGRQVSTWVPRNVNQAALARIAQHLAEGLEIDDAIRVVKATRRVVSLNGQESWIDSAVPLNAAGGGGRSPVRHLGDGTEVPGGVPGGTAGGEPPRWTSQPPNGYMGGFYDGSDRSQAHHPSGGRDDRVPLTQGHQTDVDSRPTGYWPQGGHGTGQAAISDVPGDANDRGRAPSVSDLGKRVKVSKESVHYRPAESRARSCGTCVMFHLDTHECDLVWGSIDLIDVCDRWEGRTATKGACVAAGLAVRAADTGRVLMLQRAVGPTHCPCGLPLAWGLDSGDWWSHADGSISHDVPYGDQSVSDLVGTEPPDRAAGTWEFPGGCLEPGEQPRSAAVREWQEETGCVLPVGRFVPGWGTESGRWLGFVYEVASEADVPIFDGRDRVTNPDDPDGDQVEALAWWDPAHLVDNPSVRAELRDDLQLVLSALGRDTYLDGTRSATADEVAALMSRNFSAEGYAWVDDARWVGPTDVPTSLLDFSNEARWAAHHEAAAVDRFVERLRAGETLHPAILVDTPGDPKLKVIDGHHRALAAQRLGKPLNAYVGTVHSVVGPWDEAHSFQIHHGSDHLNKTTD